MKFDLDKSIKDGVEQAMKECELTIGMTLKEAVERQIPKKPFIPWDSITGTYYCPNCYEGIIFDRKNHCSNCGQKLDWSDTNGRK